MGLGRWLPFAPLKAARDAWLTRKLTIAIGLRTQLEAKQRTLITGAHFEVIGMITISWTFLEIALDMINEMILTRAGGGDLQDQIPASLKPKLALIKRGFSHLDGLRDLETEARAIVAEVNTIKEKRHDVIHGVSHGEIEGQVRTIFRHVYQGKVLASRTASFSISELYAFNTEILALSKRATRLASDVAERFPDKDEVNDGHG